MASADGIRYITPQRSLYSRSNPKYFGRGRGITFYNFVSDQYIGFHGMVVSGTLRDSLYLLEGFLNQPSELTPNQIMTDTAGYSDMIFGLFGLLGFNLVQELPMIKEPNFGESTLTLTTGNLIRCLKIQLIWN